MPVGGNRRPGRAATSIDPTTRRRLQADIEPHGYSRCPAILCVVAAAACALLVTPSFALDLNSFRAQHGRPPLSQSIRLTGAARSESRCTTTSRSLGLSATRGCVFRTRRRKCRLWLRNGGPCHPHVGALWCASREYAAPLCDPVRVSPRRTGQMASAIGCWNSAIDSALEKPHRRACDRRNDHHHYNSEHEAGQARAHRQHLLRSCAPQQI
jgi:hypothetical protein